MKEEPSARRWWHCRGMLCAVGKRKSAEKKPANLQLSMFRAELETHVLIQMLQEHTPSARRCNVHKHTWTRSFMSRDVISGLERWLQWLKALAASPEDLVSIPWTHGSSQPSVTGCEVRGSDFLQVPGIHVVHWLQSKYTHTCIHNHRFQPFILIYFFQIRLTSFIFYAFSPLQHDRITWKLLKSVLPCLMTESC